MNDENYTSKEWEQLWEDLDKTKEIPSWHAQNKETKYFETKHIKKKDFGLGASLFGKFKNPVQGLNAEIRGGMGHIEFAPDAISGGRGGGFGNIGKEQRRALKELRKINDISISTHAHPGFTGLTGFNAERFSFEEQGRQNGINEIKKAIDFAAEVAEGGSITFHAGDFVRPLAGQIVGKDGEEFQLSPDEIDQMMFVVIDDETKKYVEGSIVRADQRVMTPIFNYNKKLDISGVEGDHKIYEFETNPDNRTVKTKDFKTFKQYAAWLVKEDKQFQEMLGKKEFKEKHLKGKEASDFLRKDKYGEDEITDFFILEKAAEKKFRDEQKVKLIDNINNVSRSLNTTKGDLVNVNRALDKATEMAKKENCFIINIRGHGLQVMSEKELADFQKRNQVYSEDIIEIKKGMTREDMAKNNEIKFDTFYAGDVHASDVEARLKELDLTRQTQLKQIEQQLEKLSEEKKEFFTLSEYAKKQNNKSFEEIGLELHEKNKALKKRAEEKKENFKPLFFAIENLYPDKYGAHPEELLEIINQAREGFANGLIKERGYDRKKAQKEAEESIKATFDTGHLHMWKKYFRRKPKENEEQFDKRFNEWALEQTKKLVDKGVIGNIHLADNFGYDDDHLTLGQGNVPIKEYMKLFDKAIGEKKITGKISIEGFDDTGQHHGVHEAWKATGSSIFRSQQATKRWTDVTFSQEGGSFGNMYSHSSGFYNKPSFIFGKYSPSRDDWGPWSDTSLE